MITEDYVSFEIAKLLKEKGFDEYYPFWYNLDKPMEGPFFYKEIGFYGHNSYSYVGRNIFSAPTLQTAMKWLREKYNIYISIQPDFPSDKDYKMCWCWSVSILHENCINTKGHQCYIETYKNACEEAIRYCLENLI